MLIIESFVTIWFVYLPPEHAAKSSLLEYSSRPFCLDHLVTAAECFLRGDLLWMVVVDRCDVGDDDAVGTAAFADFAVVKCAKTSVALSSIRSVEDWTEKVILVVVFL